MSASDAIYAKVVARDPDQPEFHQAVKEVLESLEPVLEANPEYISVVERVVEPERLLHFRVPWVDDGGNNSGEPWFPNSIQRCHRPLQRRTSIPSKRQRFNPEVPRFRADFQEFTHRSAHGWRQGRF